MRNLTKEEANNLKQILPRSWAVQNDDSLLFRHTVCDYLVTQYGALVSRTQTDRMYTNHYYGVNRKEQQYSSSSLDSPVLISLQDFRKHYEQAIQITKMKSPHPVPPSRTPTNNFDDAMTRLKALLPSEWEVIDDGSKLFRSTVVRYLNHMYARDYSTDLITDFEGMFYGVEQGRAQTVGTGWAKSTLTVKGFVKLYDEAIIGNKSTQSLTNTKSQDSGKHTQNKLGYVAEVQRPISSITAGQRPVGTAVSGRRCKTAVEVGHLSNRACSV